MTPGSFRLRARLRGKSERSLGSPRPLNAHREHGHRRTGHGGEYSVFSARSSIPIAAPVLDRDRGLGIQIPLNTNLGATAPTSGFTFSTQGHNYAIDFMLSMMESRGVGKVLSEPKGVTQNNEKLTVKQGHPDSDSDEHQQHDFRSIRRRRAEAGSDSADHRGGHRFPGHTVENTQIDQGIPLIQALPLWIRNRPKPKC